MATPSAPKPGLANAQPRLFWGCTQCCDKSMFVLTNGVCVELNRPIGTIACRIRAMLEIVWCTCLVKFLQRIPVRTTEIGRFQICSINVLTSSCGKELTELPSNWPAVGSVLPSWTCADRRLTASVSWTDKIRNDEVTAKYFQHRLPRQQSIVEPGDLDGLWLRRNDCRNDCWTAWRGLHTTGDRTVRAAENFHATGQF